MNKCVSAVLLTMLSLWGWVWDFIAPMGQFMRVGRVKAFLFGTIVVAGIHFARSWCLAIGALYIYIVVGFVQNGMPPSGVLEVVLITGTLLMIPIIDKHVKRSTFENIVLITAVGHAGIGILNLMGIYPFLPLNNPAYIHEAPPVIGLLGQQTLLAPYLVFASCISIYRFLEAGRGVDRYFYLAISGLMLFVALMCGSIMGYLSLAASFWVFVLFYLGWRFAGPMVLAAALVASCFWVFVDRARVLAELHGRLQPWQDAYTLIKLKPWVGYGIGSWSSYAEELAKLRQYKAPWTQLHNEPLQGLFELGRIGMLIVAMIVVNLGIYIHFIYLFRERKKIPYVAGLFCFGANALGNFTMHIAPHGMLMAYCVYMILKPDVD